MFDPFRWTALLTLGLTVLTGSAPLTAGSQPELRQPATAPQTLRQQPPAKSEPRKAQPPSKADSRFEKTPMPLEWQVEQLRTMVQQLASRVGQLEAQLQPGQNPVNALYERLSRLESVIQVNPAGVTLSSNGPLTLSAGAALNVNSSTIHLNAGVTRASGVLRSEKLITETVVSSTYTPGAGNVW